MAAQIPAKFDDIIAKSEYIWFTTVNEDGMPQPTPVWFVRDGDTFIIYTPSDSHKVGNIHSNPKVALGLANEDAGDYFVVHGEAQFDQSLPSANQNAAYMQKYIKGIAEIGMTPTSFAQRFSLPIRVTPSHVRGELE
jgi:PPOX class probable F420-dependent enzyme